MLGLSSWDRNGWPEVRQAIAEGYRGRVAAHKNKDPATYPGGEREWFAELCWRESVSQTYEARYIP